MLGPFITLSLFSFDFLKLIISNCDVVPRLLCSIPTRQFRALLLYLS
jgi:hypothetical protein